MSQRESIYLPRLAEMVRTERLSERERLFELKLRDGDELGHQPGQFAEISIFGIGEAPLSISSSPTKRGSFEVGVRAVGNVTNALHRLGKGATVGVRGPFGNGFPLDRLKGQDVLVVAGGIGLIPLRSLINYILDQRGDFGRLILLFGARTPSEQLFLNNHQQLSPSALKAAEELGLKAPCYNPYLNSVAQVVESVHVTEHAIELIDRLLARGLRQEDTRVRVRAGRGIGAVEAPRGILFHDYTYDERGILTEANCIIPTNQNHNSIQKDFEALVPQILDRPEDEIRLMLEMLVRSYDPCISCSAHAIRVEFR